MTAFLTTLPWLALLATLPLALYRRPSLDEYPPDRVDRTDGVAAGPGGPAAEPVSVIVPTRNDAPVIGACLATLLATDHPRMEVIVVDHASGDGTREVVEAIARRDPGRVRLLDAGPVPERWAWRAWACWRGQREAAGELLLFTDPDTLHAPALLPRAIGALKAERADLLGVVPRLSVSGFWQRLLVPHIWLLLAARFPSVRFVNRNRSPDDVVATREFMLFRRAAYDELGGHRAVMESRPQRTLAAAVVAAGKRLFLVHGENLLETHIHGSLGTIAEEGGAAAGRRFRLTGLPWSGVITPWLLAAAPLILFVVPPLAVIVGWLGGGLAGVPAWAARATALSLVFWLAVNASYRIRPAYAMAYPLGAAVTAVIFARAVGRRPRRGRAATGPSA